MLHRSIHECSEEFELPSRERCRDDDARDQVAIPI